MFEALLEVRRISLIVWVYWVLSEDLSVIWVEQ